ncbi:fmn-dependent NADH-azoreductase 1 [Roseibium sp. TrichSKD4]|uniref:FMN-dependent NADH-azoreductase n=1 Tax=Roseibium sp. TrichSKD4 TaxID=744980 RepID=UPI0001E56A04|nr:NAD(P)H-dependent oxidoreductase [Roseibium sp. TrichSKD4]EFO31078.1 fmn-dependent NADH-azoreductase 1 [Roseibium sp. TrichSKD4]
MSNTSQTILKIDASARKTGSVTRELTDTLISRLIADVSDSHVVTRDVASGLPVIDETWIGANFTDAAERSDEQKNALKLSDELIEELRSADVLVIGVRVYNFGIPASLKAWIDLVARARVTFKYTENGPVGLLEGKKAYVVLASGGTKIGSDTDFASGYLKHVLGFIGIHDVTIVFADQLMMDGNRQVEALNEISKITPLAA